MEGEAVVRTFIAEFDGVWLGGHAAVVAKDLTQARETLEAELHRRGLGPIRDLRPVGPYAAQVIIQFDGDY